jgi:hypothetical protein
MQRSASAPVLQDTARNQTAAAAAGYAAKQEQQQQQRVVKGQIPGLPNNVNLLLELQRRWGLYQLQRMGKVAQESLSSATRVVRGLGNRFGAWEDNLLAEASRA